MKYESYCIIDQHTPHYLWSSLTATIFKNKNLPSYLLFFLLAKSFGTFSKNFSGVKTGKIFSGHFWVISVWAILSNHFSKKMFLVYGFGDVA